MSVSLNGYSQTASFPPPPCSPFLQVSLLPESEEDEKFTNPWALSKHVEHELEWHESRCFLMCRTQQARKPLVDTRRSENYEVITAITHNIAIPCTLSLSLSLSLIHFSFSLFPSPLFSVVFSYSYFVFLFLLCFYLSLPLSLSCVFTRHAGRGANIILFNMFCVVAWMYGSVCLSLSLSLSLFLSHTHTRHTHPHTHAQYTQTRAHEQTTHLYLLISLSLSLCLSFLIHNKFVYIIYLPFIRYFFI